MVILMRNSLVILIFGAVIFYVLSMFYEWFNYGSFIYTAAPIVILLLISIISFMDAFRKGTPPPQRNLFIAGGVIAIIFGVLLTVISL